jgi:hypothetical protein
VQAHAVAAGGDPGRRMVDVSFRAIRLWRGLAGLNIERRVGLSQVAYRVPAAAVA